jgi:hypothetical protein
LFGPDLAEVKPQGALILGRTREGFPGKEKHSADKETNPEYWIGPTLAS